MIPVALHAVSTGPSSASETIELLFPDKYTNAELFPHIVRRIIKSRVSGKSSDENTNFNKLRGRSRI